MKAFVGQNILLPDGIKPACIVVDHGVIRSITDSLPSGFDGEVIEIGNKILMPGIVDTHVHINEPGRTEWEGFHCATQAAAAGGITTVVDMPLNCLPVTTTKEALQIKLNSVADKLWVDVGYWGGVVPESIPHLQELLKAGVLGVKSFTIHSGIDEFPEMTKADLDEAMPIVARAGLPYLIHAELDNHEADDVKIGKEYRSFLRSRPRSFENNAIRMMFDLCRKHHTRTHIVHLSSSDLLDDIERIKQELPFTVETCPHYLLLKSENIEDGKTHFKCCPPIREEDNRRKLWQALKEGVIDFIVSDHSPCTVELKKMDTGDFGEAWGGISSLQFGLSLIWTEARKQGFTLLDVSRLMSERTALFVGLGEKKGRIAMGLDADFVLFDPDEEYTIGKELIYYKNKITPYEGQAVAGKIHKTWLRGELVYSDGQFNGPHGESILRNH